MSVCRCGYEYLKVDKWPLILCCTYDPIILNIVSKVAFEHKVRVWHSTSSSDIMAIPCDIAVINRNLLGKNSWEDYVDWQKEVRDPETTLFIYVDKDPYEEERVPLNKKSFYRDFEGNYRRLLDFLNSEVQAIISEKCCSKSKS